PGRGLILKIPKPETAQPAGFTARGNYRKDVALTDLAQTALFSSFPDSIQSGTNVYARKDV
ncbi:hypothetical protein, partial [Rhodoferax sp.]|uniref:hypothetical protein n=1 Tax=Rhodoferax sp. TaxID=50421 RepID=UPI00374DEDCD